MGKSGCMGVARYRGLLVFGIVLLSGIMISPKSVNALTEYTDDLPSSYGSVCLVCHLSASGGGDLNGFGSDFSENGNDIEAINDLDSDGDGHTNEKELEAGTYPGDPDSAPVSIDGWTNIAVAVGLFFAVVVLKFRAR
jgi:hypothetical protein